MEKQNQNHIHVNYKELDDSNKMNDHRDIE